MKPPNVKNFRISNFLATATGVAGLGLVVYDAHKSGKVAAPRQAKNNKAESLTDHYMNDMKLESHSEVQSGVKKRIFQFWADENITTFFDSAAGYIKGAISSLVSNVIPFGLAVGTILGSMLGKKGGNHIVSKFGALGLLTCGGVFVLQEMFGIGKSHK